MESWWKPVTAHLLEVCQHSHVKLREFSAEAVTDLITSSVEYKHEPPLHHNLVSRQGSSPGKQFIGTFKLFNNTWIQIIIRKYIRFGKRASLEYK